MGFDIEKQQRGMRRLFVLLSVSSLLASAAWATRPFSAESEEDSQAQVETVLTQEEGEESSAGLVEVAPDPEPVVDEAQQVPAITLEPKTLYMPTAAVVEERVALPSGNPQGMTWTLNGKDLSEYPTIDEKKTSLSGPPAFAVSEEAVDDQEYRFTITYTPMFGNDLSLRWPFNIRRTYRNFMQTYVLRGVSADGSVVIEKNLTLRPYESFRTHEEMLAEVASVAQNHGSNRVVIVETIGTSAQGRDIKMAIIAKDQAAIDAYLNQTSPQMLTQPTQLLEQLQAGSLAYKVPLLFNNTHADEQPGIDVITSLYHDLATKDEITYQTVDANGGAQQVTLRVSDILDKAILLFNFTENPDGDVENRRALINGIDPNRDAGYQANPETRATVAQINKWNPLTLIDVHGFVNPFLLEPATPPHDPNFEYDLFANEMVQHAQEMGRAGITNSIYDRFEIPKLDWPGGWDDSFSGYTGVYGIYHGIMGHTIEIPEGNEESFKAGYFAGLASINYVLTNRDALMTKRLKFYERGINQVEAPEAEAELIRPDKSVKGRVKGNAPKFFPDYYVIPMSVTKKDDTGEAFAMIEYFQRNGVQVQQLLEDVGDYKAGDLVVDMAQAKRGYANHILYKGSNESEWSEMYAELVVNFPDMRGFVARPVYEARYFAGKLGDVTHQAAPRSTVDESAPYHFIANGSLDAIQAINEALRNGETVHLDKEGFVVPTAVFKKALETHPLYGEPRQSAPATTPLKAVKVYAPGNATQNLGFPSPSEATNALLEMGFEVVGDISEADVVVLDNNQFKKDVVGQKPTIVIGGNAARQLVREQVLPGLAISRINGSYEGLVRAQIDKTHPLTSGYEATDLFYSNSGTWVTGVPEGFKPVVTVASEDHFIAGWWPGNDGLAGQIVAIDGMYQGQPLFLYAGNPLNKMHTHNFYRWISNALLRGEVPKDPTGWKWDGSSWTYINEDGSKPTGWKQIDGTWFYFNADNTMHTGWLHLGDDWFYLHEGGQMATGWLEKDDTWFYLHEGGQMARGWQFVRGEWYYLHEGGQMARGWLRRGSQWYFFHHGGQMARGWQRINEVWYYFLDGGQMATGWQLVAGKWYYLRQGGQMVTGVQQIEGKTYRFDEYGALQ